MMCRCLSWSATVPWERFSIILLLTLAVGTLSLSWDNRKQFWFVLGFVAVQVAQERQRRLEGGENPPPLTQ